MMQIRRCSRLSTQSIYTLPSQLIMLFSQRRKAYVFIDHIVKLLKETELERIAELHKGRMSEKLERREQGL